MAKPTAAKKPPKELPKLKRQFTMSLSFDTHHELHSDITGRGVKANMMVTTPKVNEFEFGEASILIQWGKRQFTNKPDFFAALRKHFKVPAP